MTTKKPLFKYHTPMRDKILPSIMSALVLSACVKFFTGKYIYFVGNDLMMYSVQVILMVIFYLATFKLLARMDQTLIITEMHFSVRTHLENTHIPFADIAQFSITRHIDRRPQYTCGLIEMKLRNGKEYFTSIFLSQAQIDHIAHIVNGQLQVPLVSTDDEHIFKA